LWVCLVTSGRTQLRHICTDTERWFFVWQMSRECPF
jgi:hypothetical protein